MQLNSNLVRLTAKQLIRRSPEGYTTISQICRELRQHGYKINNGYVPCQLTKIGSGFTMVENHVYWNGDVVALIGRRRK